eukprot:scaffold26737_cov57-Phaeocystis_antarctica.AAC.3
MEAATALADFGAQLICRPVVHQVEDEARGAGGVELLPEAAPRPPDVTGIATVVEADYMVTLRPVVATVSRAVVARKHVEVACGTLVHCAVPVGPRLAYVGVEAREAGVARHPAVGHILWVHWHEEVVGAVALTLPVRRVANPCTDIVDKPPRRGSAEERLWDVIDEDARRRAFAVRHGEALARTHPTPRRRHHDNANFSLDTT